MPNILHKITKHDPLYPSLLHETHDPPPHLYCMGLPLKPQDRYLAIVGTRRPSVYGKQMAEEFSFALAKAGFTIVSGLAYGIDAIAHAAALQAGGTTIAVLGSGLNYITPTSNAALARSIQKSGTIITEFEAEMAPNKGTFPQRNRIIAGMCPATLVIEAPERSGALITARIALEQNRDVFAVPGSLRNPLSQGCLSLIQQGAKCVTSIQDIL